MKKDFVVIPHTADLKIKVYGSTLEELFRNALIGMFQSIGPQAQGCRVENERLVCPSLPINHEIVADGTNYETLLVNFLSEALYFSDINNEAYLDVSISFLDDTKIKATLFGIKVDRFDVVEIKAVTYHDLAIKKVDGGWQTNIVFDI